jgi:hypothetical protein
MNVRRIVVRSANNGCGRVRFTRVTSTLPELERARRGGTTLRQLVETVGASTLHVASSPLGLDVRVRTTVVFDVTEPLGVASGALLLASGVRVGDADAVGLLRSAASCGYCAVIVKRRGGDLSAFLSSAAADGLAVLVAADDVAWREIDALLRSALEVGSVDAAIGLPVGDELFVLADAIAMVMGGSVAIEDLERRIVAYSSLPDQRIDHVREQGILGRRVPHDDGNPVQYGHVLAATGVVRFPQLGDELARSAIAIKAGSQPLGTIWAIEDEHGLGDDGEQALVEGALRAALQILRAKNSDGLKLKVDGTTLQRCFDGLLSGPEAAFRLSLPRGCELVLLGFAVVPDVEISHTMVPRVAGLIGRHIGAYRPDSVLASTPTTVYLLLPGGGMAAALRFASGACRALRSEFDDQVRVAVGEASTDPTELLSMKREVDDILRATTSHADLPHIARLAQVRARVLLTRVADELVHEPRLRHLGVDTMCAYDRAHGGSYVASVLAWLDHAGDVTAAAAHLDVHPNTLRYRLRRAQTLFGLALDDPDDRLSVWLQLRIEFDGLGAGPQA